MGNAIVARNALDGFLSELVSRKITPGAVAAVCDAQGLRYSWCGGDRQIVPEHLPMLPETIFDLASLTKVVATTMVLARLQERGELDYTMRLDTFFPSCGVFSQVTLQQIATHTGGFIAEERLWDRVDNPEEVIDYILTSPALYEPGTQVVYSCFGFIILGAIIEKITGKRLDTAAKELVFDPLGMTRTSFNPLQQSVIAPAGFAATEVDERTGGMLCGTVHDENARFLSGIAGNAGCFSCLEDLVLWCRMLLGGGVAADGSRFLSAKTIALFSHDFTPTLAEARGLGFKVFEPAREIFGHTGFTGTSVWVDPSRGIAALLLANRVHPTREERRLIDLRPEFHRLATSFAEAN